MKTSKLTIESIVDAAIGPDTMEMTFVALVAREHWKEKVCQASSATHELILRVVGLKFEQLRAHGVLKRVIDGALEHEAVVQRLAAR